MASAAEQLAANINFAAFAKAKELQARIWFTLMRWSSIASARSFRFRASIPPFASSSKPSPGASSACSTCSPAARRAHGHLRAERDAVHLGVDHHAAPDDVDPALER
jgi:hypothetical protein